MRALQSAQRPGPGIQGRKAYDCKYARAVHRCASLLGPEGGSEYIPIRKRKRQDGVPSLDLSKEDAVQIQLLVCRRFSHRRPHVLLNLHRYLQCIPVPQIQSCKIISWMALQALQNNDTPYQDAGVELLYR